MMKLGKVVNSVRLISISEWICLVLNHHIQRFNQRLYTIIRKVNRTVCNTHIGIVRQ